VIINKIHIIKPEISYEKTLSNSNIKQLMKNIEAFTGPSAATPDDAEPKESSASKQVIIQQLIIEDGTIFVGLLGAGTTVPLPRIEMNNIGEDGNRKSMAQVLDLVLTEVLKSLGPAIANTGDLLKDGGKAAFEGVKEQGLDKVGAAADEAVKKANESMKKLFGN
jgi:hypothetical protein